MASPLLKPILGRIPLIGPLLKSNSRLKMFTPEEQKKLDDEYRNALGLGDKVTLGANAFEAFDAESFRDLSKFEKTKSHDGKTILEKLDAKPDDAAFQNNASLIKNTMEAVLEPTPEFKKAQEDYQDAMDAFNELKKQVPSKIRADALIGLMAEIQDEAIAAIEAQHQRERDKLEAEFSNTDRNEALRTALKETLGAGKDANVDTIKANLMKDLEASHSARLEEFKKSTSESMTKLHQAAAAQNNELIFIANLHKNNEKMRDEINRIAAEKRQKGEMPQQTTGAVVGIRPDHMAITGLTVADLPMLKSLTGKEIKRDKDKPEVFIIEYSNSIMDFFYNQSVYQNILTDHTLTAAAIRASGNNTITWDIDGVQPESEALNRARSAYHGAIKAGFPKQEVPKPDKDGAEPDHIIIKVNGKEMRVDELFKDNQAELQSIHAEADEIKKELKANEYKPQKIDTKIARAAMDELRNDFRQKRLEEVDENVDEDVDEHGASLSNA